MIGYQRVGRRNAACFADTDAQSRQEYRPETLRHPRQGGEAAPDSQRNGYHPAAAGLVGEPRERYRQSRIEQGKGDAAEQPHLGVAESEIGLDRTGQDRQYLAVDEVENIDQQQHAERYIGRGRPALHALLIGHLFSYIRKKFVDCRQRIRFVEHRGVAAIRDFHRADMVRMTAFHFRDGSGSKYV